MSNDWKKSALCRTKTGLDFFAETTSGIRKAKSFCKKCPVAAECFKEAISSSEIYGIWGGISQRERRRYHNFFPVNISLTTAKEIVQKHGNTVSIKSG